LATPVWLSAGLAERPLTSACFILKAEDSIPELLDWNSREGLIFQQGGGAGINLSAIRSSREPVSHGGLASGPGAPTSPCRAASITTVSSAMAEREPPAGSRRHARTVHSAGGGEGKVSTSAWSTAAAARPAQRRCCSRAGMPGVPNAC
jgi:hypothetical protein